MAFVITQPCIDTMDKSCVEVCPVDCIHFEEGADRMLYIDPVECIDCGACQPACPVSAIFPEADVPADQAVFKDVNTLWYQDRAAARAKIPATAGEGAAAQPAAAAETPPPASPAPEAAEPEQPAAAVRPARARAAAPEAEAPEASAPAAEPPPVMQVPAGDGPLALPRPGLSPLSIVALVLFAVTFTLMWAVPGPIVIEIPGGEGQTPVVRVGATVLALLPVAVIAALLFLRGEGRMLARFGSREEAAFFDWRSGEWTRRRRNEESRQYALARTVNELARSRFPFPTEDHADLRTHVNMPEPELGVEVGPGGEKLFPDILVTREPGSYPAMIAMVETKETVTREQAYHVWKRLENRTAPLYLYVPAGHANRARAYASDVGLSHYRLRTWRQVADYGLVVKEV